MRGETHAANRAFPAVTKSLHPRGRLQRLGQLLRPTSGASLVPEESALAAIAAVESSWRNVRWADDLEQTRSAAAPPL
jgi:hypothetical protein